MQKKYIYYLTSDELKRRKAGSESGKIAAEYIASNLNKFGTKSLGKSYFQIFNAF